MSDLIITGKDADTGEHRELTSSDSIIDGSTGLSARLYNAARFKKTGSTQTLTTATPANFLFDSGTVEQFNHGVVTHSTSSNSDRFVFPAWTVGLIVDVQGSIEFEGDVQTDDRRLRLLIYNSEGVLQDAEVGRFAPPVNSLGLWANIVAKFEIPDEGSYIVLEGRQSTGGDLDMTSASIMFSVVR